MTATDTTWVTEGAEVAEYRIGFQDANVKLATIERLTNTQIVLDNGNRYSRDRLRQVGGDGRNELRSADDPAVRNVVAREAVSDLRFQVDRLLRDFRGDVAAAQVVLDEVAAAVAAAQAATRKD